MSSKTHYHAEFLIYQVAYCIPTAITTCPQWPFYKGVKYKAKYKINIFTVHYLPFILYCYISNVVHHHIIKIISMFYTVEVLVKKSVVTGAGCLQEYYCSVVWNKIIIISLFTLYLQIIVENTCLFL